MPTISSLSDLANSAKQSPQSTKIINPTLDKTISNKNSNLDLTSSNSTDHISEIRQPQFSVSNHTFNMFLIKSIEKIASEKETRKSQNLAIKKACEEALILLKEEIKQNKDSKLQISNETSTHLPPLRSESGLLLTDEKLLRPFQLACTMKSPKIVITAIDSLQKLIAYGHIPNTATCSSGKVRIIEQIVTTICSCFQGVNTDDGIQLQILKALLTVITSSVVEIHEADILLVVRTCYNIFMATKNLINQATARATLTQIISVIFQRMEQNALEAAVAMTAVTVTTSDDKIQTEIVRTDECDTNQPDLNESDEIHNEQMQETINESMMNGTSSPIRKIQSVLIDNQQSESNIDLIVKSIIDELVDEITLIKNDKEIEQYSLSSASSPSISTGSTINQSETDIKETCSQIAHPHHDHENDNNQTNEENSTNNVNITPEYVTNAHITQKDAFLVFRSLCRLAIKDFTESNQSNDSKSHIIRSKTLSLELLLNLLQQPGPLFSTSEIFLAALKQYLCVALFKNGHSTIVQIFELTITIFLTLLTYFKPYLKRQIEIFFKDVLLFTIESNKSSNEHKLIVLDALRRICSDAQCVVDIYLNYDCDLNMTNIFERLTTDLAKIAQIRQNNSDTNLIGLNTSSNNVTSNSSSIVNSSGNNLLQSQLYQQQLLLRSHGLECLVLILRCMTEWSQELYQNPDPQSFLGAETNLTNGKLDNSNLNLSSTNNTGPIVKTYDDPEDFESRKAQKGIYESGIALFNQNYTLRGLRLLQDKGLIGESVESVAQFLISEERLSKLCVGDFLGENEPYNLRVMYAYVDQFDFTGKNFVASMREFLSGFRLPGEAQKIDRLMEKFAARYCVCNPGNELFASADTAYVLAFSIIMLTTDLHSSQIKAHHRMSKEDYIRMNKGINDSQDLPESYLAQIYDEIASSGLKIKSDHDVDKMVATSTNIGANTSPKHDNHNVDNNSRYNDALLSDQPDFTFATHCEHVRPMFKLAWTPFLAAFSVGLQDCDDLDVTHLCLEGIRYAIRIACIFHMDLERDAYVQALSRFTLLLTTSQQQQQLVQHQNNISMITNTNSSTYSKNNSQLNYSNYKRSKSDKSMSNLISTTYSPNSKTTTTNTNTITTSTSATITSSSVPEAMKQKNIDTIRSLITVAQTDGNYLGHSWLEILRCISQLESAHLITHASSSTTISSGMNVTSHNRLSNTGNNSTTGSVFSTVNSNSNVNLNTNSTTNNNIVRRTSSIVTNSNSTTRDYNGTIEPMAPGSLAAAVVDSKKAAILQEVMGETGSHSVLVAVDKIFTGSIRLNGDAIVEFVKALCQVSREELNLPQPRTFSLQKVVEISYYNMGRIRLQWSRVWEHIGSHFTTAGRSKDEDVAEFVIDSLRQLAVKLIEKGELPHFHFQKEFLRPFVNILDAEENVSHNIQDLIVRCMYQLVHSQYVNIRSGWVNIFTVLYSLASTFDESIVDMAFDTCQFTVKQILPNYLHILVNSFQPLVKALAEFACNPRFPDTAMESIHLIRSCATAVAEQGSKFITHQNVEQYAISSTTDIQPIVDKPTGPIYCTSFKDDDDQIWLKGWMPVLCELFRVITSCKLDVRTRGLTVFFDILKTYGSRFKPLWWHETFAVIFRVFQHFRNSTNSSTNNNLSESISSPTAFGHLDQNLPGNFGSLSNMERTEWMNTTCNHTLFSVVDVFTQFYDVLHDILLDDVYHQLHWCCIQEHEQLARSGTSCLETLILSNGQKFDEKTWESTVNLIVNLFQSTVPYQLLTWRPEQMPIESNEIDNQSSPIQSGHLARAHLFANLLNKCVVQYELIQTIDHILFYSAHSRNEDVYYLQKSRQLASDSYPAFAIALEQIHNHNNSTNTIKSNDSDRLIENSKLIGLESNLSVYSHSISDTNVITNNFEENNHNHNNTCEITNWGYEPNGKNIIVGPEPLPLDTRGMYPCLTSQQLLTIINCLLESHTFAKQFNSHDEQRNILFQAGFKVKAKPNLLKQETHSLLCVLRILFRLADEQQSNEIGLQTDELLDRVLLDAFAYYHSLIIDGHRQAWDPCLILIMTQLTRLRPMKRFHKHAILLYPSLCNLIAMAGGISPQVAALIRLFLLRCSALFIPIQPNNHQNLNENDHKNILHNSSD